MSRAESLLCRSNPATARADGNPLGTGRPEITLAEVGMALGIGLRRHHREERERIAAAVLTRHGDAKARRELREFLISAAEKDRARFPRDWPEVETVDYLPLLVDIVVAKQSPEDVRRSGIRITDELLADTVGISRSTWCGRRSRPSQWKKAWVRLCNIVDVWVSEADTACKLSLGG